MKGFLQKASILLALGVFFGNANAKPPLWENSPQLQQAYESFQTNADIVRLQHLKYWVNLIEAYHAKTGKYPFQGQSDLPIMVEVATPQQQAMIDRNPPNTLMKPMTAFVAELEKGLGRRIDEYYDPQFSPDYKPNFYLYMIHGDEYFMAVHTHQAYPFARQVAPHYYKVEVSNRYDPSTRLILTSKMLFTSQPFRDAIAKPIEKKAFFDDRAKQTLHISKQAPKSHS